MGGTPPAMFHCFSQWRDSDESLALARETGAPSSPVSIKGKNLLLKATPLSFEEWITQKLLDP
jgi:hypothetical protein